MKNAVPSGKTWKKKCSACVHTWSCECARVWWHLGAALSRRSSSLVAYREDEVVLYDTCLHFAAVLGFYLLWLCKWLLLCVFFLRQVSPGLYFFVCVQPTCKWNPPDVGPCPSLRPVTFHTSSLHSPIRCQMGRGRMQLWCTRPACLFDSSVLQPTCQNCWFAITFAAEDHFWHGCHTSTGGVPSKQGALLLGYLSSRHPGLHKGWEGRSFCLSSLKEKVLPSCCRENYVYHLPLMENVEISQDRKREFLSWWEMTSQQVCRSKDMKVTLVLIRPSSVLTLRGSFYVQAMMHQPNLDKSGGTGVLVQPPCAADTSENGSVLIPAAVELSGYFELLMLSAGH